MTEPYPSWMKAQPVNPKHRWCVCCKLDHNRTKEWKIPFKLCEACDEMACQFTYLPVRR